MTTTSPRHRSLLAISTAAALTLAACGSDDESADLTDDEPAGAVQQDAEVTEPDTAGETPPAAADRPTRDELCEFIDATADELAAVVGLTEIEETNGSVLGSDCALEGASVGYVSLSLLPAISGSLEEAAASFDGTPVESPGLVDGVLIEDPAGFTQVALFDVDGVLYRVQVEGPAGTTPLELAEEAAIRLQFQVANR